MAVSAFRSLGIAAGMSSTSFGVAPVQHAGRGLAGLIAVALLLAACDQSKQETTPAATGPAVPQGTSERAPPSSAASSASVQPPKPGGPPLNTVESLVAPIALYPDPLLAELLVASTYPLEIVQAARWLETKPDLATLKDKDWDPSVQRLTEVPSVVKMMNDHLEWTTALGNAFLEDPESLLGAVQTLRGKAVSSGFLKDTPQQTIDQKTVNLKAPPVPAAEPTEGEVPIAATPAVLRQDVITIKPAKDDTLYVPQYSPEVAYSAPLAPPPGATTTAYPTTPTGAYPAPSAYYPTYAPAATTTTESSSANPWLTFGAGALVGGLVTWGIMELADDDDWDDRGYWGGYYGGGPYRVVHHYGDAVCYRGNCWNGGGYRGGGYRGDVNIDRGDINRSRDVNISGNQISRDRTFQMSELKRTDQVWQHDPEHRRGQRYSAKARERLGDRRQPDLAGQRRSGLQGVRDGDRGIGAERKPGSGLAKPSTLESKRPLSSDEIRGRLSGKKPEGVGAGGAGDIKARREQAPGKLAEARNEGAFSGAKQRGDQVRQEGQRGKESRQVARGGGQRSPKAVGSGGRAEAGDRMKQRPAEVRKRSVPAGAEGKLQGVRQGGSGPAARPQHERRAQPVNSGARQQQVQQARRREFAKPTAFGGARDGGQARNFSQRGAASRSSLQTQRAAHPDAGRARSGGGGGFSRGGGGGHTRGGGGLRHR